MEKIVEKKKKRIRLLVLLTAASVAVLSLMVVYKYLSGLLQSQRAAERFRGTNEQVFAQVTAIFPAGDGTDRQGVFEFEQSLEAKLEEASLEASGNGSLYTVAYSAPGKLSVTGNRDTAEVQVLGVGGDFFQFHPFYLRSGVLISGDDLMDDLVVLDEELAWRLFGGIDVAGMTVLINNTPFLVSGVVSREDDFASEKSYTDGPGMFMSYDTLNAIQETQISTLEVVCAEPVSGFTRGVVESSFSTADVIQNSGRFSVSSIFGLLKSFGERSARTKAIAYPYWENAARMIEDYLCLVLVIGALFAVVPATFCVIGVVRLVKLVRGQLVKLVRFLNKKLEDEKYKRYRRKQRAKIGGGSVGGSDIQEREEGIRQ